MTLLVHEDLVDLHSNRMQPVSEARHFFLHATSVEASLDRRNVTFFGALVETVESGAQAGHRGSEGGDGRVQTASVQLALRLHRRRREAVAARRHGAETTCFESREHCARSGTSCGRTGIAELWRAFARGRWRRYEARAPRKHGRCGSRASCSGRQVPRATAVARRSSLGASAGPRRGDWIGRRRFGVLPPGPHLEVHARHSRRAVRPRLAREALLAQRPLPVLRIERELVPLSVHTHLRASCPLLQIGCAQFARRAIPSAQAVHTVVHSTRLGILPSFELVEARLERVILVAQLFDVVRKDAKERLEWLEAAVVLEMCVVDLFRERIGGASEPATRPRPRTAKRSMWTLDGSFGALVDYVESEAALDGGKPAELAFGRLGRADGQVILELVKAKLRVARCTSHCAFRAGQAVRRPILAHDLGRAAASPTLCEILVDVLVRAVRRYMAAKQMSFALVIAALVLVGASHAKCVDHVFDKKRGGLKVGKVDGRSAGWAAFGAQCGGIVVCICPC